MEIIRKIIKEELLRALIEINNPTIHTHNNEDILYNFELGRAFGVNKLAKDIKGLEEYYMSDYFPRSEMEEGWVFEIESSYGSTQLVEINHKLDSDYKSYWNLKIAEVERGSNEPKIIAESGFIKGYEPFFERVNLTLEKIINPNLL